MTGTSPDTTAAGTSPGRRRAAGIYGSIVTAAILTAAGGALPTVGLALAVVVTLVVYWVAEEYAELLGEHVEGGRLPGRRQIGAELAATWPMVTASYGPVAVLLLAGLAGASRSAAANTGLAVSVLLLVFHVWSAGRVARLRGWWLVLATSTAALLGLMLILLKNLVLLHLH
ncbi:hypothetical protein FPZ12_008860 [Amycolatopsis acidicola]|uniref:Uncharacterized protein n=1 Tax=Amycolatopsis acidicola TaxID=2596893 RepID=A0A5N0VDE4_9PSEU|nr:hypothetical protein [Amycolatopsis acidicola]KAA9163608.1 hypothetical protein FPZ12_008860 [Amycolatopsis acidicola]